MIDVIIDTLMDSIKLLPFLFVAFLLIEILEHKLSSKSKKIIEKETKYGPIIGGVLGIIPQCGFSVMATNLYVTRIITIGTLIAVYLSTSDEMIPILLSEHVDISIIVKILLIKLFIGILAGFIIDFIVSKKNIVKEEYDICEEEHCHCEKGLIHSTLVHTFKSLIFIMIVTFILNILMHYVGENAISKIFMKDNIFASLLTSLVGLIPNCGASIMLSELYIKGAISFSSTIAGLLTGSGVALLVLFRSNKNIKENIWILSAVYLIGAFSGIIIEIIERLI